MQVRCAHGDTVMYPLANIEIQLASALFTVKVAMSDRLLMLFLLGTDITAVGRIVEWVWPGD